MLEFLANALINKGYRFFGNYGGYYPVKFSNGQNVTFLFDDFEPAFHLHQHRHRIQLLPDHFQNNIPAQVFVKMILSFIKDFSQRRCYRK